MTFQFTAMFSVAFLLAFLALSITGSPVEVRNSRITLPMTRRLKFSNGTNLMQQDEARLAAFRDYSTNGKRAHVILENDYYSYIVSVGIGDPPTSCKLVVDSGSAITWVGADRRYAPTKSSFNTKQPLEQSYGQGSAFLAGMLWTDTVTFGGGLTMTRMPIGVPSTSRGIIEADGILGIGPTSMTLGKLQNSPEEAIQTVTDLLYNRGKISQHLVGIFFQPSSKDEEDYGELSFGEIDHDMYTGNIAYTPVTTTGPSARYWGIKQRITYGTMDILESTTGIVDCGSTLISIASDAYEKYQAATGADLDPGNKFLTITPDKYDALQPLNFHIGEEIYSLTPNAQIWPRSLNDQIDGAEGAIYLVVKSIGRPTGSGHDFTNGYVFLQRFYTVLDSSKSLVGFATTLFTDDDTN
ncbi:acid protease, partial [Suillus spraguei]